MLRSVCCNKLAGVLKFSINITIVFGYQHHVSYRLNSFCTGALERSVVLYFRNCDLIIGYLWKQSRSFAVLNWQLLLSLYLWRYHFHDLMESHKMIFSLVCSTLLCSILHCFILIFDQKLIFFNKQAHLINKHLFITVFLVLCLYPCNLNFLSKWCLQELVFWIKDAPKAIFNGTFYRSS